MYTEEDMILDLRQNLSSEFRERFLFEEKMVDKIRENAEGFFWVVPLLIMHPSKPTGEESREKFIDDAQYICEYGIQLNFGENYNAHFYKILVEIHLDKKSIGECLKYVRKAKAIYVTNEKENCSELEELYILEWHAYTHTVWFAQKGTGYELIEGLLEHSIKKYKAMQIE